MHEDEKTEKTEETDSEPREQNQEATPTSSNGEYVENTTDPEKAAEQS